MTNPIKLLAACATAFLLQAQSTPASWTCDRSPLVVTNAAVWTPEGILRGRELTIVDGNVQAIGESGKIARPKDARIVDAGGATVLPGLVDAHAHLDALPGPGGDAALTREVVTAAASKQTLASGVTTVRMHLSGLEDGPALKRIGADPCAALPRVVLGGPGLNGGTPDLNARLMRGVRSVEDGRAKVRELAERGFDWLAVHGADRFAPGELGAIVADAKRTGLRVMASGDGFDELRAALAEDVDSIEYLNRTTAPEYPADLLARLRERRNSLTLVVPVGYYTRIHRYRATPADAQAPEHVRFYPPESGRALLLRIDGLLRKPEDAAWFVTLETKFRQLRATGVPIAAGSDSGSPTQFHIDAIWHELRTLHTLGLPPMDVVRAATSNAGRLLSLPEAGRLQPGDRADLVIYRGDLAKGEFDLRFVDTVVKGGVVHVRKGEWVGP